MYVNHDSCHQINLSIRGNAYLINETTRVFQKSVLCCSFTQANFFAMSTVFIMCPQQPYDNAGGGNWLDDPAAFHIFTYSHIV